MGKTVTNFYFIRIHRTNGIMVFMCHLLARKMPMALFCLMLLCAERHRVLSVGLLAIDVSCVDASLTVAVF